ncbi:MAG: phage portal protein [Planctomycetes bacterium]|nr:phage portal protein [Planctomycetota bacterium]
MKSNGKTASATQPEPEGPLDHLQRRLHEAYHEIWDNFVDPDEAFYDSGGLRWTMVGGQSAGDATARVVYDSAEELREIRRQCRLLAATNEFAINGHENRISYIVGEGHTYRATPRKGRQVADDLPRRVQEVLDAFIHENAWSRRQQEIVRRCDRDGEAFLRLFRDRDGMTRIRFVEPDQIVTPVQRADDPSAAFGIQTDRDDVETVLAYYVDGRTVDAAEIQHRKMNVDANVRRGLPLFFPVRKNLRRAEKLLRNMSVVAEIQSAIALIRKHHNTTRSDVQQFVDAAADTTVTSASTGKVTRYTKFGPGTILDAPRGMEYEFPASGIDASNFVIVLQAELRAIASRLVMPEFMLTSDASNANFSSTLVAEGPAIKMFARLQAEQVSYDREIMWQVISGAVEAGLLPADVRASIEIQIGTPSLAVRDVMQEAEVARIEFESGILSPQSWSQRRGLDYDQEQANIADHAKRTAPS